MPDTTVSPSSTATGSETGRRPNPSPLVLTATAGAALVVGSAAFFAGMLTSPPAASDAKVDYLASLARDPGLTQVSAVLLHYGNLLMGAGFLVLPLLVRGRRGAWAAVVGALLSALALINTSGALVTDWFHLEIGRQLSPQVGAALSDAALSHPLFDLCFRPGPLTLVATLVLFTGLARAGVIGWWSLVGIVAGTAGLLFLPYDNPVLPALGVLPMLVVFGFAGVRTLQRARTR